MKTSCLATTLVGLVACGLAAATAAETEAGKATLPANLLREARGLARERSDHGDQRTTALLRLAATMGLAGMRSEAVATLEECLAVNARDGDGDVGEDEVKTELALLFLRLGAVERARALMRELRSRQADLVGQMMLAQAAVEMGDREEAMRAIRTAAEIAKRPDRKQTPMSHAALCRLARLALDCQAADLAEEVTATVTDGTWRSVTIGDRAESLARAAAVEEAMRLVNEAADPHMRVLALARIAAACPLVDVASFPALRDAIDACPPAERSVLAEQLVVGCGSNGLAGEAVAAAALVPKGWPRVRGLCDAAVLPRGGAPADGPARLLAAATAEIDRIEEAGWRCHARAQIALAADRCGLVGERDRQLEEACQEAAAASTADEARTAIAQAVEAALTCGRKDLAARSLTAALSRQSDEATRNVLVPMLVEAGEPDAAVQQVAESPLTDDFARRFVVCRLARAGRLDAAAAAARRLPTRSRDEALADVALAQLDPVPASPRGPRKVGLSLHGGWYSWVGQLEHLGISWEVMPFSLPYLEAAAGMTARYRMLGFPGAGDHHFQVSAAGDEHVRDYLRGGGGLFGICAGQLFAVGHPTGHRFMPTDFHYLRGQGPHQVQMAPGHPAGLGLPPVVIISRKNGDFLLPQAGCDVLGWYDTQGICAAASTARYGLGRVAVSSPHPESGRGLAAVDRVFIALTLWALGDGE